MSQKDFALILGVNYGNFNTFKKGLHRVKILKIDVREANSERELEIQALVAKSVRPGSAINYTEFLELYEAYRSEMNEKDFARVIGISNTNLNNMIYRKRRAKILKFMKIEITKERKEEIQEELKEIIPNESIEYPKFKELYKRYEQEMSEEEFAYILGISYSSYMHLKNGKERATIRFETEINNRIKYEFLEARNYTDEEIRTIAIKYGVSVEYILNLLLNENEYYINLLKGTLNEKGEIFLGQKMIRKDFTDEYGEQLMKISHEYSKALGINLHTSRYSEDIAQDAILKTIQTKGDVVENLPSETAIDVIVRNIKVRIKYSHIDKLKLRKHISLDEKINPSACRTRHYKLASHTDNQQIGLKNVDDLTDTDENPISVIQICLTNGMNRTQALQYVMDKFSLSRKQLIKILEDELAKTKSIRTASDGTKYLSEKDD